MKKDDDREAKAAVWLQRLREAATAKEPLMEYARRHGVKPGEAYHWRQSLRRVGRWPAYSAHMSRSKRPTSSATPRFARVRIAAERRVLNHST